MYSCRNCSKQFSTKQGLGGHQNSHIIKKNKQKKKQPLCILAPRPPFSTTHLQHSPPIIAQKLCSYQLGFFQTPVLSGGNNRVELREPVLQPIVYNGPRTILHANDHNKPVNIFGDRTKQNIITLESDIQKEVAGLEGKEELEDHFYLSLHL